MPGRREKLKKTSLATTSDQEGSLGNKRKRSSIVEITTENNHNGSKLLKLNSRDPVRASSDPLIRNHKRSSRENKNQNRNSLFVQSDEDEEDSELIPARQLRNSNNINSVITILSSDEEDEGDDVIFTSEAKKSTEIIDSDKVKQNDHAKSFQLYECPICFDSPEKTIALPCGHCYCFECLFQAFGHSRTSKKSEAVCALCRASYTLPKAVPLKFKFKTKS